MVNTLNTKKGCCFMNKESLEIYDQINFRCLLLASNSEKDIRKHFNLSEEEFAYYEMKLMNKYDEY